MSAVDEARNDVRTAPRPALFALYIVAVSVPGLALLTAAALHLDPSALITMDAGQQAALATAFLLVALGEARPIFGSRAKDPLGVPLSTMFIFPVLLHFGLLPALVMHVVATVVGGLVERRAPWRVLFNIGQYNLALGAAWAVVRAAGHHPTLLAPWTPRTLVQLAVIVLAATACFIVNVLLVSAAIALVEGAFWHEAFLRDLRFHAGVSAAQFGIAPVVVVLMQFTPALVVLSVLPVYAIHQIAVDLLSNHHQANHDDLTGLANRKTLVREATEAIAGSLRTGDPCALILLDLDRFKEVNDVLGHKVGDQVLRRVAERLADALRPGDLVTRLGGDEFAVLLRRVRDTEAAIAVASRLRSALDVELAINGQLIDLEASVGVAIAPEHASEYEVLFSRADVAMYQAKVDRTGVEVYDASRDANSTARIGLISGLRHAMEHGEIEMHYQPQAMLSDMSVTGVEALVRWNHPERGLIPPDDFIPVAEQSGMMHRLTALVLDLSLAQMAAWSAQGMTVPVAVNVSLRDLLDSTLPGRLAELLERHSLPPELLTLEITERVLTADMDRARLTLQALRDLGVRLSLDDFGTGWSSLRLLRELPIAEIKIDRSFVSRAAVVEEDAVVVRATTSLAHGLGMHVVAEGIETAVTWQAIAEMGCDTAQGWYLARPMPARQATRWLATRLLKPAGVPHL